MFSFIEERGAQTAPRTSRKSQAARRIGPVLCEALDSRLLLSGLAPANIVGDTLALFGTGGTGNDAPPAALRIAVASSGNGYTGADLISATAIPSGTYTYSVNSNPNDAKLVATNSTTVYTIQLAFSASGNGTYTYSESKGTQSGVFILLTPPVPVWAPTALSDDYFTFSISGAAGPNAWASSGSYSILVAASGDGYALARISSATTPSSGAYVWDKTANAGGGLEYHDSTNSTAGVVHLAFTSANAGLFYNTDATSESNLTDFQWGTFALQTYTTTALSSTLNPAVSGDSVTIKATVSPNTGNGNTATGMVTFKDGSTTLGSASINGSGVASYTSSSFTLGTHSITAIYAGDSNFTGSTSSLFKQYVTLTHAQNLAYVTQMYHDILNRSPDSGGLTSWTAQLDAGTALQAVALGLSASTEYYADVVTGYYEEYLGRAPDTGGLQHWVSLMQSGTNAESIRVDIVASTEYYNDGGGTPAGYITELYEALLGRGPDAGGLAHWETVLANSGAAAVATGFIDSTEYYSDVINGYYEKYLERPADSGGLANWVAQLQSGVSESVIISDIVSTAEYLSVHSIT